MNENYIRHAVTTIPANSPLPPDLVARAAACLHPWSGASPEERERAHEIIREASRRRRHGRFLASLTSERHVDS